MVYYFFVDSDGTENMSHHLPLRHPNNQFWVVLKTNMSSEDILYINQDNIDDMIDYDDITELPPNTIQLLFKKQLTWNDEPIILIQKN